MTVRYIYTAATADGVRISSAPPTLAYGPGMFARFSFDTAAPVELPTVVLTKAETNNWLQSHHKYIVGFCANPDPNEVMPPPEGAKVEVQVQFHQSLIPWVILAVGNAGDVPIPRLNAGWTVEYESPQPLDDLAGLGKPRLPPVVGDAPINGQGFSLAPFGNAPPVLPPKKAVRFFVPHIFLRTMLSQASAMSPEQYGVNVNCGSDRLERILGLRFADAIDKVEQALTPTRRDILILDNRDPKLPEITATLGTKMGAKDLEQIETEWEAVRAKIAAEGGPSQHDHWDWRGKVHSLAACDHLLVTIECEKMLQGAMAIWGRPDQSKIDGSRVLHVDYIEIAPWNLKTDITKPRFYGVGLALLVEASRLSREAGWGGRVGLHSLPQAERFYAKYKMIRLGNDPECRGMAYFEMTEPLAADFLTTYLGATP